VVELWLDIGCPWCYLGRHRLDRAIEATASEGRVEVVLRSFELNPGMSTTPVTVAEYLAAKFAGTVARAREADDRVAALARADGLPYTVDRRIANSFDVHRVLHLARERGVGTPMFRALQRGYFAGELDPFDPETLVRVAADAGVPAGQTRAVLSGDGYAESVRREQAVGRALGITGVPFAVLGGAYGVAGAQSVEGYAAAIRTALTRPA
jgi:predicted DsbA family dithiol-disulfide isomerase